MNKHWIASLLFHQWVLQCELHLKKKSRPIKVKKKNVEKQDIVHALQYNI